MELIWDVSENDISLVRDLVNNNRSPLMEGIIARNLNRQGIIIDKDTLLKTMLMCLLAGENEVNVKGRIDAIYNENPPILTYQYLLKMRNVENAVREVLMKHGFTKHINKVPDYFARNFEYLVESQWDLEHEIRSSFDHELTKFEERELADKVDQAFKGFGSREARCFLLFLGVSRYELPIDHHLISWLESIDFPLKFSRTALQDKLFYHFVSDGLQLLCEKSGTYPCILYAGVLSAIQYVHG